MHACIVVFEWQKLQKTNKQTIYSPYFAIVTVSRLQLVKALSDITITEVEIDTLVRAELPT